MIPAAPLTPNLASQFEDARKNTRHRNYKETVYWYHQWRLLAEQAFAHVAALQEAHDTLTRERDEARAKLAEMEKRIAAAAELATTWRVVGDNYTAIQYEHASAQLTAALTQKPPACLRHLLADVDAEIRTANP